MSDVTRYDVCQYEGDWAHMEPCSDGDWVHIENYQALEAELAKVDPVKAQLLEALSKAVHYMEQMQDEVDGLINYAGGTGGFGQYEKHIEAARSAIDAALAEVK